MLTSACQLRCSYCYAEAGDTKTQHLSSEIARKAITIVARNASQTEQRQFTVHLHGAGEPTLMPGTIASLLDHISVEETHWSTICRKIMSSNFCVPPQQAVSYARSLTQIFVSSDGPPDIADAFRPMAKKGGSSGAILENALAAVYGAQLSDKITIRCTVSSATQRRLCEITRYFSQFGIRKIYFVPVSSLGRGQDSLAIAADVFVEEFRKCGRVAESLGVSIYYPGTDLSRARLDGYACGIKGSNFAVLPDGTVSVCYEAVVPGSELREAYRIGTLSSEGLRVDESRVQQIAHSTHVSQRAACNTCFCRLTCAGQCAARNVAPGINKRDLPMTDACDITRALTQAAIEDL
ncbi:radical SAM protein [Bradyrhizobium japonicum]|uniref:radical SAM protein n=1 Tax=Bradyrhizobium japonicum TaxID=375 RepID=UPI0018AD4E31|nr:SPASM domain-containing protein [Bradyrhizobium japonicum]